MEENNNDKHLWLEEVLDEKALHWVRGQNEKTFAGLTKNPEFEKMVEDLTKALASKEKIPYVDHIEDGFVYNLWSDETNIQGLYRRTTIEEFKKVNPQWEILLDYDQLSKNEGEKWVSKGFSISPDKKRALVFLSPGGSDADIMRELDMETKIFVKDGFILPLSKGGATWLTNDEVLLERDFGPETLTSSGYARTVRQWKRGEKLENSKVIFEIPEIDTMIHTFSYHEVDQSKVLLYKMIDFYTVEVFDYTKSNIVKLDLPSKMDFAGFNLNLIYLTLREDWKGLSSGDLAVFNFSTNKVELIYRPDKKSSIYSFSAIKDGVLLVVDTDVTGHLLLLKNIEGKWMSEKIATPPNGSLDMLVSDKHQNDFFMAYDSFNTPVSYYHGHGNSVPQVVKKQPGFFNFESIEIHQHFATSLDGTKVPYFLVHKKGLELNGKNPTILYGYGGFQVSLKSHFSNLLGLAWLDKGGVYVLSNIRGGGEYGPDWHQTALKENRDRAYQDFFAIAEELINKKITSRDHLGAWGGSNGGLLMGVAYTQRPDLFKAINCGVPLLDMHRYHKLLAGHSWVAEYGNPDDEVDGKYIRALSPYHRINKDEKNYSVMYLNTSTKDDRVHPGHARKFAAKLEEYGHAYLYHENIEGGHAGASNFKELAFMKALDYAFFWKYLK